MINCRKCPYEESCNMGRSDMQKDVLDLINRQKAEIEKLEKESEDKERAYTDEYCLREEWQEKCKELLEEKYVAKSEAVREFAERLKDKSSKISLSCNGALVKTDYTIAGTDLDNLVKEMVGDTE